MGNVTEEFFHPFFIVFCIFRGDFQILISRLQFLQCAFQAGGHGIDILGKLADFIFSLIGGFFTEIQVGDLVGHRIEILHRFGNLTSQNVSASHQNNGENNKRTLEDIAQIGAFIAGNDDVVQGQKIIVISIPCCRCGNKIIRRTVQFLRFSCFLGHKVCQTAFGNQTVPDMFIDQFCPLILGRRVRRVISEGKNFGTAFNDFDVPVRDGVLVHAAAVGIGDAFYSQQQGFIEVAASYPD